MLLCLKVPCTFFLVVIRIKMIWYKHSATTAEKLRLSNPSVIKYLLCKLSVDDMEWVCQSCYKHPQKNKILPCAIKNGMSFPLKPDFFDLNELECRLLALRLALQNLMQAPRGNQFKIKGNVVNVPADVNNIFSKPYASSKRKSV